MRFLQATSVFALMLGAAHAQTLTPGSPPGMFQSPAAIEAAPPVYVGIGDLVTVLHYWGGRCVASAYTGIVEDIWDSATGSTTETQLTCSAGGIINQTVNALSSTCAAGCEVAAWYDQEVNSTSSVYNITAAHGNRPTFNYTSCGYSGGTTAYPYCMTGVTASAQQLVTGTVTGVAQPFDLEIVAAPTATGVLQLLIAAAASAAPAEIYYSATSGTSAIDFGTVVTFTGVTAGSWHALFGEGAGAASYWRHDATNSGAVSAGTNPATTKWALCGSPGGGNLCTASIAEAMILGVNEANWAAINANQHAYWGF